MHAAAEVASSLSSMFIPRQHHSQAQAGKIAARKNRRRRRLAFSFCDSVDAASAR